MNRTTERTLLDETRLLEAPRRVSSPSLSWWGGTAERWDQLELDGKVIEPVHAGHARMAGYRAASGAAHEQARVDIAHMHRAVARGDLTFHEAADRLAHLQALEQVADPKTAHQAALTIAWDITAAMRTAGDTLITKHLAPAYDAVIGEARELAPAVAAVENEQEAMRAGGTVASAWSRLMQLAARRVLLRDLARRLRDEAIVTVCASAWGAEYEYRRPEVAKPERTDVAGLVEIATGDSDPALLTAAEVDALEAAREEPLRIPKKQKPIVRSDGSRSGGR